MSRVRVGRLKPWGEAAPCSVCGDVPALLARPCKEDPLRSGVCERCARKAVAMFDRYAAGKIHLMDASEAARSRRPGGGTR